MPRVGGSARRMRAGEAEAAKGGEETGMEMARAEAMAMTDGN